MPNPRHAEYQKYNPLRPVDWRWQRAQHLVATGSRLLPRRDDELTLRAARYLRTFIRCRTDRQFEKLLAEYHDVHTARELHNLGGHLTLEIDARLLARETPAMIASKCSLGPAIVETYEQLFFHVTDRLNARDYILLQAIGLNWADWLAQRDLRAVVKSFAYFGGSLMLDLLLASIGDLQRSVVPGVPANSQFDAQLQERAKLAVATTMLPVGTAGSAQKLYELTRCKSGKSDLAGAQTPQVELDLDRLMGETFRDLALRSPLTQSNDHAAVGSGALAQATA